MKEYLSHACEFLPPNQAKLQALILYNYTVCPHVERKRLTAGHRRDSLIQLEFEFTWRNPGFWGFPVRFQAKHVCIVLNGKGTLLKAFNDLLF